MDTLGTMLALGAVIAASNAIQTMTGFGATVIALTVGALFVPVAPLKMVLVLLNIPLCLVSVVRHPDQVDRKLLLRVIAPWMAMGFVAGVLAAPHLDGRQLRYLLGIMVVALAARDLLHLSRVWPRQVEGGWIKPWIVGAGAVQGVLASGGPLLVRALATTQLDRSRFRTSLLTVWLTTNVILVAEALGRGALTWHLTSKALWLLPSVGIGIVVGEYFHHRVSERQFAWVVQGGLVVSGLALLIAP